MIAYVYNDANPGTLGVIIKGQTKNKVLIQQHTEKKNVKPTNNFRGVRLEVR